MKSTRKITNTIFAVLLGLVVIAAGNQAFAQGGIWETKAPMPAARWSAAGGVINGKLYVAGGGSGTGSLATLEVYDPATNTWATKAPMPTARNGAGGAVINGKLYVVGGQDNQKLATLEVYDPATDTWTTKAAMPTARSVPGVVAINGQLYVAGGCQGWCAPVTNALEVYDPATDNWTTKAPLPTARGVTDVGVVDGLFYVMGGCCGWDGAQSELMARTIEVYNPTTNTWTSRTPHIVGGGDTVGSINGKIYVAKFAATEVYDPTNDTWASLSPMLVARYYAAGGVIDGKLYVAGGYDGTRGSAALDAFTPADTADTIAPVLALPASITTNATSPAGAIVSYTVTATDNSGASPTIACTPASGGTFPIGATKVSCTASDAAGNSSSGSFAVTVNGPATQGSDLMGLVQSFNLGGIGNSLNSKLQNATSPFATNTCNQFNAFINEASAQLGKKLTVAQAIQLIAGANQVRAAAGCP